MKSILFSLCFFPLIGFANGIDSLQTDADVYRFLVKLDSRNKPDSVNAYNSMYAEAYERKVADSLHVKLWQKTDFNNDGQTDLLVCAFNGSSSRLLAVVSNNGKYKIVNLTDGLGGLYGYPAIFFPVIKKDKKNTTIFVYFKSGRRNTVNEQFPVNGAFELNCIKLVYKFNSFTELNSNPTMHTIQNLTFSGGGGLMGGDVKLSVDSKREVVYAYSGISGNPGGTYSGTIDTATYNELVSILNYINFPEMPDRFYKNVIDAVAYYLSITYDNGKIKKIQDYPAGESNYGLNLLYNELSKLEDTRQLKKVN